MDLTKYHYAMNAMAYFELDEKFNGEILEAVYDNSKKGVENICYILQVLSEQGELMRRQMGYDKEETFKAESAIAMFRPKDILTARAIIEMAFNAGMMTSEDDDEVDVTLVELKKKKD